MMLISNFPSPLPSIELNQPITNKLYSRTKAAIKKLNPIELKPYFFKNVIKKPNPTKIILKITF
jgi:hypothetical protein